ncbi:MAG TPA: hypothetical protein VEJ89_07755 [Myxococcaceae bacterium]|jgi:hypothetical protein|nr:hypothetical protein [Myxococcaceae bacterium]
MRTPRPPLAAGALLCALLTACTSGPSTQLVQAWQLPGYVPAGFRRVLVIAVTRDGGRRRTFEDAFSYQLMGRGVTAISSYTLIPEDGQVPNAQLEQAIRSSGADGVLATRFLGMNTQVTYTPGAVYGPVYAGPVYYGGFYGYYGSAWGYDYVPASYSTDSVVTVETDAFDAAKLEMVWSGTTQTKNPTSIGQEMQGFAKVVIDAMSQRGILAVNN